MARSINNVASHRRHKKILKRASGYRQGRSRLYQFAKQFTEKGLNYAWRDRRQRKRQMRRLWMIQINAAAHQHNLNYHQFISGLKKAGLDLNRKTLAHLAQSQPATFQQLVKTAKSELKIPVD